MARYGTAGLNNVYGPAFTGWTPTLGGVPSTLAAPNPNPVLSNTSGRVEFNGLTQDDNRIANLFQGKSNQAIRLLLISMIGAVPGALVTKSFKRVKAQTGLDPVAPIVGAPTNVPGANLGGLVPVETVSYINRTNTVTDDNNLSALLNRTHGPAAYPADISTIGGGSKAQISVSQYF